MDKITINSLFVRLEKICCKLQDIFLTLSNQNAPNKNDWEVVCLSNDGGVTIVTGIAVFDVLNGTPTTKYYIDNIEVTGYTIVSCETSGKDREILSVCVDGKTWTKIIVFEDGLPITFLWLDDTDTVVPTPDPLLINNSNCNTVETCLPSISEAYGNDLSTLLPSHNFSIQKPDCCVVKVTTNVGVFSVQKGVGFYNTSDFKCPISITGVEILSGSCTLDKVYIIGNKLN
jgi:hypothetical protein